MRQNGGKGLPAVLIEAFTTAPLAGNGAAVVLLEHPAADAWLQGVAGSLRQSETAFLLRLGPDWQLRWFTPTCEVPLCGHATLAALLALVHWNLVPAGRSVRFLTRSGPLAGAVREDAAWTGWIELPAGRMLPHPPEASLDAWLQARVGSGAEAAWSSDLGYEVALLPASAPLCRMGRPGGDLPGRMRRGLVLMQPLERPDDPADYRLRFFAPDLGIEEDPVTGSAHALVAPWWMERLGRRRVVGWQCSDRPGGMVCEAADSGMIRLTGSGVLLWDGRLREPPPGEGHSWPHWPEGSPAGD